jgi:hypothetical protein
MTDSWTPQFRPEPGLDGSCRDTCVACGGATDTGLGSFGLAEWHIAFASHLGIPQDQATIMLSESTGCSLGRVPIGEFRIVYRICGECAGRAGVEARLLLADGELIVYPAPR